ncbi:MAG: EF-hand domain-containing protein [Planctomycetota bacterium]
MNLRSLTPVALAGALVLGGAPSDSEPVGAVCHAEIIWWFDFNGSDDVVPDNILNRITEAMDSAVSLYNAYADYSWSEYSNDPRGLRVIYQSSIATANAGYRGRVAFGGKINDWTAMHEMAHVFGVGTRNPQWNNNRDGNVWTGQAAIAELALIDGPGSRVNADRIHFWPYGLNTSDGDRHAHVRMVGALREDMGLSNRTYRFDTSDFNRNGRLDEGDLDVFISNWLTTGNGVGNDTFSRGDRNLDGSVDLDDWPMIRMDFLAANQGALLKGLVTDASVPEPSATAACCVTLLACASRRRRNPAFS